MRALSYLHGRGITHADIKLENCLFASDRLDSLRLVDFGLSFNIKDHREVSVGSRGTLSYMAPELLLLNRSQPVYVAELLPQVDVWSAGVILFILTCGHFPFLETTHDEVVRLITSSEQQIHQHLASSRNWSALHPLL